MKPFRLGWTPRFHAGEPEPAPEPSKPMTPNLKLPLISPAQTNICNTKSHIMVKKAAVPDAWDDDWESQADKAEATVDTPKADQEVKLTKAEKLAKHAEINRKIWQNAWVLLVTTPTFNPFTNITNSEEPETPYFLAARDTVPFQSEFKPALKVLSRKPAPKLIQRVDPLTGLAKMALEDEDEEEAPKNGPSPEELRLRAQREREEKQKRYDEARARIMGTSSATSTPGTVTPPIEGGKGRGRGRGGRQENQRPSSQSGPRELFDPNYTPKPAVSIQKRNVEGSRSGTSTPREEELIIRAPRGPDGQGSGFAKRGGKTS